MIDEFQDTSEVQWHNFKPLIDNSLSQDFFSMIVGDVKQSIYRWRNGDWRILATEVEKDFAHHGVNEISLDTNWRSLPSIISFNNTFFELAKDKAIELIGSFSASNADISSFQSQIEKAYKGLAQKLPESKVTDEGYVEVRFFEKGTNADCDNTLSREIPQLIKKIKENHKQNDIAILVRTKGDGQRIANMLLDYNRNEPDKTHHISFVSQEGLQLKTSSVIRLMVAAFSLVQDASNEIAKRILAKETATLQGTEKPDWHFIFDASQVEAEAEWLSTLTTKPLQEVFEIIVSRYKLHSFEGELAHLAELQEHITNLSSKGGTDVNRFLHWWEQKGSNLALSVPDSSNALSIQTIHKSKGLQYPVVIVPYANWAFRQSGKSPLLWVSSNEEPFNLLPKYPILASNAALNSFFASDILEEEMREVVDNINLLYVAFTRPEKELYVFVPLTKQELNDDYGDMKSASKVLRSIVPNIETISKTVDVETNTETYTMGKPYAGAQEQSKKLDENSFWLMDKYPVGADYGNIKFKREAEEFFLSSPSERFAPLEHGKVMHELFSRIKSVYDIDNAIQELNIEGLVNSSSAVLLSSKLKETLSLPPYSDWFSGNWEAKTEATILTPEGYNYRPDRVMQNGNQTIIVDFKFGEEIPSHRKQILRYMDLLKGMGYDNVEGFVWYVESNRLLQLS
jgi:ATP-dependent helicase/nuclease subunit A